MFHTLHIVERDTRLCPYLINCATLYPLLLPQLRESSVLTPLRYSSSPSSSASTAAAAAASLAPARSSTACSRHRIPTRSPLFLSTALHRSRIGRVAIYCKAVFCLRRMQVSIRSNPASYLAASAEVYSHLPPDLCRGSRPISRCATWYWNPPRTRPMWGVTAHVSAPKSNTNWTTALKKNPDTCGLAPSLLKILVIFLQNACAFIRSGSPPVDGGVSCQELRFCSSKPR